MGEGRVKRTQLEIDGGDVHRLSGKVLPSAESLRVSTKQKRDCLEPLACLDLARVFPRSKRARESAIPPQESGALAARGCLTGHF